MGRFCRIIFFFVALMPTWATAQTMDCEQTIAYATEEFNAGHFYLVPAILDECMSRFSRDQRQRAQLLLTQTYLLLDDPVGAKRSYLEVLAANPEFVPDEQLHAIDVVYLSKRFTAVPKFSWFLSAGTNVSPVRVIAQNEITNGHLGERVQKEYALRLGYGFGAGGEYSYDGNFRIRLEANMLPTRYYLEVKNYFDEDVRTITDRQTWLNLPVYLSYTDNRGQYRPYGYVGYSFSYLFADRASMTAENVFDRSSTSEDSGIQNQSIDETSPTVNFLYKRNRINQAVIVGAGIKYKVGLDFVYADLRYSAGLKNIVNPDGDFVDPRTDGTSSARVASQVALSYGHRDDYFRLDNIAITIGFIRPLYKPRELKRARTRSVLRKMTRGK